MYVYVHGGVVTASVHTSYSIQRTNLCTLISWNTATGGRQITPPRVVENSTQAFGKSHPGLGVHPGFWKIPPRVLEKCSDTTRI